MIRSVIVNESDGHTLEWQINSLLEAGHVIVAVVPVKFGDRWPLDGAYAFRVVYRVMQ